MAAVLRVAARQRVRDERLVRAGREREVDAAAVERVDAQRERAERGDGADERAVRRPAQLAADRELVRDEPRAPSRRRGSRDVDAVF